MIKLDIKGQKKIKHEARTQSEEITSLLNNIKKK
jgi:hypothetical protein